MSEKGNNIADAMRVIYGDYILTDYDTDKDYFSVLLDSDNNKYFPNISVVPSLDDSDNENGGSYRSKIKNVMKHYGRVPNNLNLFPIMNRVNFSVFNSSEEESDIDGISSTKMEYSPIEIDFLFDKYGLTEKFLLDWLFSSFVYIGGTRVFVPPKYRSMRLNIYKIKPFLSRPDKDSGLKNVGDLTNESMKVFQMEIAPITSEIEEEIMTGESTVKNKTVTFDVLSNTVIYKDPTEEEVGGLLEYFQSGLFNNKNLKNMSSFNNSSDTIKDALDNLTN